MATVLFADTDPHTADVLPRILSDHLPRLVVDVCTSIEDLTRHHTLWMYDTIAISPILLQGYHLLKYKAERHLFAPLLVTAGLEDLRWHPSIWRRMRSTSLSNPSCHKKQRRRSGLPYGKVRYSDC